MRILILIGVPVAWPSVAWPSVAWPSVAWPSVAWAHLIHTGLGPFIDGLTHLFVTLLALLPVIGLALLAGMRGRRFGNAVLAALPLACLAGAVASLVDSSQTTPHWAIAAVTIPIGGLVAADTHISLASAIWWAIMLGLICGTLIGGELSHTGASAVTALGIVVALFVVVAICSGYIASIRAGWARIVVRIVGSWIAATGILMFSWAVRVR